MPKRSLGMALGQTGLALLVAAFAVEACGGDSKTKPDVHLNNGTGGTHQPVGGSAGSGVTGGDSGEGGMGAMGTAAEAGTGASTATGAPTVKITSPVAVKDPSDGDVIVTSEVDVLCTVTKSTGQDAQDIAPESVVVE